MRAIKVRIYPTNNQKLHIHKSFGCARLIYNKALALKIDRWENFKENLSWIEISKMVTFWKKTEELSFLGDPSRCILEQTLRHLDRAYTNFFKHGYGFPKFKSKHDKQTFTVSDTVAIVDSYIKFPKMGFIKCKGLRKFSGKIKTATLSMNKAREYFISWCVDDLEQIKPRPIKKSIGIDLGIVSFATLSNGEKINNPKLHDKHIIKVKHYQKKQAKSIKGCSRFKKYKLKIAKEFNKINNKKTDFLHKLTRNLVENQDLIAIENLKVRNMSKSAKGNEEKHGKNVKAKSGLNREILKLSWSEFRRLLEYKAEWYGAKVVAVDPKNTSQICPVCGFKSKGNRKTQAKFECISCRYTENADIVASVNILKRAEVLS